MLELDCCMPKKNPQRTSKGLYFEYNVENVEWCCDKMRAKEGTRDLQIVLDKIEGEGLCKRWFGKCPFCGTPLIFMVSGFFIEKEIIAK